MSQVLGMDGKPKQPVGTTYHMRLCLVGSDDIDIKRNNEKLNEFYTESVDSLVDDDYQTGNIGYKPEVNKEPKTRLEQMSTLTHDPIAD